LDYEWRYTIEQWGKWDLSNNTNAVASALDLNHARQVDSDSTAMIQELEKMRKYSEETTYLTRGRLLKSVPVLVEATNTLNFVPVVLFCGLKSDHLAHPQNRDQVRTHDDGVQVEYVARWPTDRLEVVTFMNFANKHIECMTRVNMKYLEELGARLSHDLSRQQAMCMVYVASTKTGTHQWVCTGSLKNHRVRVEDRAKNGCVVYRLWMLVV